jgi:hypothetical protein
MLKAVGQFSVVCQDEKPFSVIIETSHRKEAALDVSHKFGCRGAAPGIMGCGEYLFRLVQDDGYLRL